MNSLLFIDRDGTLIVEPPITFQTDRLELLEFYPKVISNLHLIATKSDFQLIMISNQDGLGTTAYPQEAFDLVQQKMLQCLENESIHFDAIHIDPSLPEDNSPNRKPRIGMLKDYLNGDYDIVHSYVIGDRITDVEMARNIGCKAILLQDAETAMPLLKDKQLLDVCILCTTDWDQITTLLLAGQRIAEVVRKTNETDIFIHLNLDGSGQTEISTGLGFFDHMLSQIGKHAGVDLTIRVKGDLQVDEHHTIEDTALALGEAFRKALGDKRGVERYGSSLPMDDSLCQVAIDFGGRPWLVWKVEFKREKIGEMPTEMFFHFFKSLSDTAKMNINIQAEGENEHHKIEGIFKAFARAVRMAIRRDIFSHELPSTKGSL
jgi:imidazoleglycerol-phosphate dehydratase/histidinol-phosphatase